MTRPYLLSTLASRLLDSQSCQQEIDYAQRQDKISISFSVDWSKDPCSLTFGKWSLILFDWSCECACRRVLCMSHFILLYGSLDVGVRWGAAIVLIVHGDVTNGQHDVTNQRHDVSDSQYLKRNQYHRLSRVFGYWEYLVSEISQSRGLSVNPISGQLTMYIFWLVLGARHFLSCRVIICNCHWEHPPEGCVQSN